MPRSFSLVALVTLGLITSSAPLAAQTRTPARTRKTAPAPFSVVEASIADLRTALQ
jgi:hypothetical protein